MMRLPFSLSLSTNFGVSTKQPNCAFTLTTHTHTNPILVFVCARRLVCSPMGNLAPTNTVEHSHLGKNPLVCDCNLRWLAEYLEANPIETSEARCEAPAPRNQGKKLSQLSKQKFKCEGKSALCFCSRTNTQTQTAPTACYQIERHQQQRVLRAQMVMTPSLAHNKPTSVLLNSNSPLCQP